MFQINQRVVVKTNIKHHIQKRKEEKIKIKKIKIFSVCMGGWECVVCGCNAGKIRQIN